MEKPLLIADYLVNYTIFFAYPIEDNEVFSRFVTATSEENAIELIKKITPKRARNFEAKKIQFTNKETRQFGYID